MSALALDTEPTAGELVAAALAALPGAGLALAGVPGPGPWHHHGRCRHAPPEVFFPTRGDPVEPAKEICRRCPVLEDCRRYALEAGPELRGVWGAMSEAERRRRRREEPAPPQPALPPRPEYPDRPSPSGQLYETLERLADHPGRWARVARYPGRHSAQSMASLLRNGHRPVPPGAWTFEGRINTDTGGSDLYAICHRNVQEAV